MMVIIISPIVIIPEEIAELVKLGTVKRNVFLDD